MSVNDWCQLVFAAYFLAAGGFVAGGVIVESLHDPVGFRTLPYPVAFTLFVFIMGWLMFPIAVCVTVMDARAIRRGST